MKCLLKWLFALALTAGLCALLALLCRQNEESSYITLYDSDSDKASEI